MHSSYWSRPCLFLLLSDTLNLRFAATRLRLVYWIVSNAFCYAYEDLLKAQVIYETHPPLIQLCLMQPLAIVEESSEHILSTEKGVYGRYADLGAGIVELVTDECRNLDAVGVSGASND
ncbi:hypothetical protein BDV23DRAFT_181634 [Aspergillus alliaceus]|uniref:Uncharacterized protein n=1 Tax=Petromyces alliaceus TaxID=209559 RepID=A0A5N7CEB1_PETAA|nr:hypothetical protein BDV23DRAFT_181634 [Aspergillus alliaceus]